MPLYPRYAPQVTILSTIVSKTETPPIVPKAESTIPIMLITRTIR